MSDEFFVIDAVGHAIDFSQENRVSSASASSITDFDHYAHKTFMGHLESKEPGFRLSEVEYVKRWSAEDLASAFFVESDVSLVAMHSVVIKPLFANGCFRWDTSVELAKLAPGRVLLYAGIDTFSDQSRSFYEMEQRVSEGATAFKFYPSNGMFDSVANDFVTLWYDDAERAYPYFEKCIELGVKTVAIHKSQPMGSLAMSKVAISDISVAAARFPELNFELVHTGWSFVEEASYQLSASPNVYANLENVFAWAVAQPKRFAHVLGKLLLVAPVEKIFFASGCSLNHPDPQIEAFKNFQMPEELVEDYGYEPITDQIKRKILGENYAAMHGLKIDEIRAGISNDRWAQARSAGKLEPWAQRRQSIKQQQLVGVN